MILNGRAVAASILAEVKKELPREVVVRAVTVSPNAATESYLKIKAARAADAGMMLEIVRLPDTTSTEEVCAAVTAPGADAVIVQLPLPAHLHEETILAAIPLTHDADVLSREATEAFESGVGVLPPVVGAVEHILYGAGLSVLTGKRAVVVGQGKLVGKPVATYLRAQGAEVTVLTRDSGDFSALADADIIVSGAGVPGLIQPHHIKEGVILIDAGTSEQGGAIVGDADPTCAQKASVFTPVPGGVGPIAVACLFRNVLVLLTSPLQEERNRVD